MLFGGFHRAQPPNPWMHFKFNGHKIPVEPTSKHCMRRHVVNRGSFAYMIHIPVSFCCRGPGGVSAVLVRCAGAVNGDDHVVSIFATAVSRITFCRKTCMAKNSSTLRCPCFFGCVMGASWLPPVASWAPPPPPQTLGVGVAGAGFGKFACNNKPS